MKNYLVIGASSGIGESVVSQLALENSVYATFNNNTVSNAENVKYHHLNVESEDINLDFLPDVIHGFVYCPGTIILKPFNRLSAVDFENDYRINVTGMVKVLQLILPNLRKANQSSIVLFSSVAAQTGMTFHSVVSASKSALEGITKALAAEFAPKIRVNCIAPSLVDTSLAEALLNTEEKIISMSAKHPLKRVGKAEDIANMVAFLLSEKSSWITGQVLHVDGGMGSLK